MTNEETNTGVPVEAIPAATDIIFASAIPLLKNLSGCFYYLRSAKINYTQTQNHRQRTSLWIREFGSAPYEVHPENLHASS